MAKHQITLLVEPLSILLGASHPGLKTPAIQRIVSRGDTIPGERNDEPHPNADTIRCSLFGLDSGGFHSPVAALHLAGAKPRQIERDRYYLRCDPVTLSVDRVSVRLTGHGFADLDAAEQAEISRTIESALAAEGINGLTGVAGGWILALPEAVPFAFPPLSDALGSDCSDLLPDLPDALPWKRILNEIQMALHDCAVNRRRREHGWREINSVWFWGGGAVPAPSAGCRIRSVFSDHPLSRGLAVLHGCTLHDLAAMDRAAIPHLSPDAFHVLVDWEGSRLSPQAELAELEQAAQGLADEVRREGINLRLIDGAGAGWLFDRRCARRFWRRNLPLLPGSDQGAIR